MSVYQSFRAVRAGLGSSYRLDKNHRYVFTQFRETATFGDGIGGAMAVTDAVMNYAQVGGVTFQLRNELQNDSAIANITADGLLLVLDAADNDGMNVSLGRTITGSDTTENANSIGAFLVGTDEFFLRVKLDIVDVSDSDQISVGFGSGVYPIDGNLDTELDFAGFNIDAGQVNIETVLNNGATTVTDTTINWADNGQHVMEIRVNRAGLVKFLYDDLPPTTDITGFSMDSGDTVHAQVSVRNATTDDPEVTIMEWESGLISSRGLADISDTFEAAQS